MPTNPTFDANGLVKLTFSEVQANMKESVDNASALGPEVSTGAHTAFGMLLDSAAIELSVEYDLVDDIWASGDADQSEGVQQDNQNNLRGAVRNPARFSTAVVTCTGTPTTPIAAGKRVAIGAAGERWAIDTAVVIGGGGTVAANVTAVNSGAITASATAINTIIDAVAGWTAVSNAAIQASTGEAVESNTDFRNRSQNTALGTTTEEAIYTRLSELDDVDAVVVVSNRSGTVDANGTNPNTTWIVIYPATADQQVIAETIWGVAGAGAGIPMRGAVSATVTDASGDAQQIKWDWATAVDLWASVTGTKDSDYPAGGDTLVDDALVAYYATVKVGADANQAPTAAAAINAVPGITTLAALLKVGSAPGPGDTTPVVIAINQYAVLNATVGVTIV